MSDHLPTLTTTDVDLHPVRSSVSDINLYKLVRRASRLGVEEFILSTPETRSICNNPFVLGLEYTDKLSAACARALKVLRGAGEFLGEEQSTNVLTILRGGLNFGLREACGRAFGWSRHSAWYVSAQRQLTDPAAGTWEITEDSYKKVAVEGNPHVVFGDVVATGTSLAHGLKVLAEERTAGTKFESVLFFTIGAPVTSEILASWKRKVDAEQQGAVKCLVVYVEGVFAVAQEGVPLTIKLHGTDLLRRDSVLAPEFIASQYENPAFPLERCTIYDAGSRAFHVQEYIDDVIDYWEQVAKLAEQGMTFEAYLSERMPEPDPRHFDKVSLRDLCHRQLDALRALGVGPRGLAVANG